MKPIIVPLVLALAYFVSGRLGLMIPAFGSTITLIWMPAGIAVAALFRYGYGCWPGIAVGAVAVNMAVGVSLPAALGMAVGNTCGTVMAAWALRRVGFHPAFDRPRDIFFLSVTAIFGMVICASVGVASLALTGALPAGRIAAWLTWWAGDAMGVIIAAPLVFALTRREVRQMHFRRAEFAVWLCVTTLVAWGVFVLNRSSDGHGWALSFLPLPMVAWAALRYGPIGTSVALIVISVMAAYGTATRHGPFYRPEPIEGVAVLWIFMATAAALGWLISALHRSRVQATGIQRLFEQALNDVSLGVLLAGNDRRITFANEGFTRLTGYKEAELLGKSCSLLHGPGTDPATVKALRSAIEGGGYFDGEILNYRKDGTPFWNALLVSPVNDERGVKTGFLGIQRDITKRKQVELALQQSEEHLRTIIDLEPECVKVLSGDGKLLEMNPAGLAMIEACSLDEVRGRSMSDLVVPEDRDRFLVMHRRVMNGERVCCEFAIRSMTGNRRWVETNAVPYRDAQREIIGVLGITRDITERKEAAAELERSLTTLQLFINTVPAYISFVDAEERYRLVNRRYEEYFGRPASEFVGRHLREMQPPAAYAEMQPHVRAALAGQTVRYQSNPPGTNGQSRWFDVQYVPRRGENGVVSGFFVLVFDITENKQVELALRESRSRLDGILNELHEVVYSSTADGSKMLFISASVEDLYGWSVAEFMADPQRWFETIHPDDKALVADGVQRLRETGSFEDEYRIVRPDGSVRWVRDRGEIVPDDTGQPIRLDGIVTDITARKSAEDALREGEARYRQLFEANPHPMWVYDLETLRFLAVNAAAISHYGFSKEEFLAMTIKDIRPPEDIPSLLASVAMVTDGLCETSLWRHRKRDGTIIDVEITSHVLDFDGRRAEVVLANDVTERKQAEEALMERDERLLAALSASGAGTFRWDIRTNALTWDEALAALFGLPRGQTVQSLENFIAKVHPDDRPGIVERCERCARDGVDFAMEVRVIWPDGSVHWLDDRGKTFCDAAGKPVHMTGACVDITARKQGEEHRQELLRSLQESQVRLETLVGNLPGMAYRCQRESDWTMTYVSDGCEAITGYPREDLERSRAIAYAHLVHPEDRSRLWSKSLSIIEAGTPWLNEYRILDRQGRERWVSERATGVFADDGGLLYVDGFIQDITAARRAKAEREQLDRKIQDTQKLESLGVLAGGIAHDFNNLLTTILGNASLAAMDTPPGSPIQVCLEQITEASHRAADLCKQMLAYSGRGRFVVQTLDLGQLLESTAQMLQISISKKAVLRFRLEKNLPPVEVDATQIRQIIMNLVINASEAIGDRSGVISISTGLTRVDRAYLAGTLMDPDVPEGEYVFLEVSDNGCGMSPESQAKIFDPFYTTKFTGRGLGLAAVLGIVRGHKGAMKVYSEVGRGTTFKLLFPTVHGASETQTAAPAAADDWHGKGSVLVVDDEETMRSTVARMLRLFGLDPVLVADGREAVEVFRENPARFALVLLDLTMPHMDGEQTFTELRRLRPDVRVVLMSGFNAQEAMLRFTGKGLAHFLQKPFAVGEFRAVLKATLGGS